VTEQRTGPDVAGAVSVAHPELRPLSDYEVALQGFQFPLSIRIAFDVVAGLCLVLLGHPALGAVTALACALADWRSARLLASWLPGAAHEDSDKGMLRLAVIGGLRGALSIAGPLAATFMTRDAADLAYLLFVCATLVALSVTHGSMSRVLFTWMNSPALAGMAAGVLAVAPPLPLAAGALLGLVSLFVTLLFISIGASRFGQSFKAAHLQGITLIGALEAARDQALLDREAAEAAREEARRANEAKSNFLATMSHEIRTPMNGVLGMAQLIRRSETDPDQIERVDTLIQSGEFLLAILNDILDTSKIDAGRLELNPQPLDLASGAERLIEFWRPRAQEKGLALNLKLADDLPRWVLADALRTRQVLFNLIGNALKFTDEGAIEVSVSATTFGDAPPLIRFCVADSGVGIAPADMPTLFDRFSQADASEARRFGGAGLGLAISKQLTELMGGRIWATSTAGRGSTFYVELPMPLAEAPAAPGAETPAPAKESAALRVLAVDDNKVNLMVAEQMLKALGHDVATAVDGPQALEMLAQQPFDIVLMDIQMPGMSGIEALSALRRANGPNRTVPVLALTADVVSGGRERYLGLGFTEHASKPIQIPDLLAAMERALLAPSMDERLSA